MAATGESLSVIALISGGKDSFYSILHCQANGHRVVALANLYPSREAEGDGPALADRRTRDGLKAGDESETDLNSFMYQTVGHQIIPLYAAATGLPLYRQPIVGTAVHRGLSYQNPNCASERPVPSTHSTLGPLGGQVSPSLAQDLHQGSHGDNVHQADEEGHEPADETESLVPLLRTVLKAHPEANALCTGAILSTYQRTRVESVALRLGLVPLSYLWQFTELPAPVISSCHDTGTSQNAKKKRRNANRDDARLLREMAAVGLEARIIKVASAGLDESFLWEKVTSEAGVQRVERTMRRFGGTGDRGTILGEGGEFETLVIDGPHSLFRGRIVVPDENRRVIREGGGCAWLSFRSADIVTKNEPEQAGELQSRELDVPIPAMLSPKFEDIQSFLVGFTSRPLCDDELKPMSNIGSEGRSLYFTASGLPRYQLPQSAPSQEWCYFGSSGAGDLVVKEQIVSIVDQIRRRLDEHTLPATAITNSVILLRRMSDFPLVNEHYGSLFYEPNPPSRVTISCGGDLLPADAAIAVYLSVQLRLQPHERRGLHVQSRSYWAPANIGPYSQAVAYPLLSRHLNEGASHEHFHTSSSPLAVSIAGQIPLVPASMTLPAPSTSGYVEHGITLALQHLWRIGAEMQVRWWTTAVAYFPVASSTEQMRHRAMLAATAWKAVHTWPQLDDGTGAGQGYEGEGDEDSDDDDGPDLWDRRYNPQFMTYGGGDEDEMFPLPLPDWSVLTGLDPEADANELLGRKSTQVPAFFAAEVEELPRQAGVEWHAHLGLADIQTGCVSLYSSRYDDISLPSARAVSLDLHHVVVKAENGLFIQTTAMVRPSSSGHGGRHSEHRKEMLEGVCTATAASLADLFAMPTIHLRPKMTYNSGLQVAGRDSLGDLGAFVPCRSLWDSQGLSLSAVCIFETRAVKWK